MHYDAVAKAVIFDMYRHMNLDDEYNNRARCPDHEDIMAGWVEDAARYRASATSETGIAYGDHERQCYDWFPTQGDGQSPIMVFIHGGYWMALNRDSFSHLAKGVGTHGLDVAMPSYRLAPEVSVANIIQDMRDFCLHIWQKHQRKLVVSGHSAGGHLAAAMFAIDWAAHGAPADLVQAGIGISGLYDLRPLMPTEVNKVIGIDLNIAETCSPLISPTPRHGRFEAWVGGGESREFLRQSETLAAAWSGAGIDCVWQPVADDNHFTVIRHLNDADSDMTKALVNLSNTV